MKNQQQVTAALDGYRVLDLTEGGCMIGAKMLGDLGADVIKIEPLGGSPSRIAPFYKDTPHPEKSLFWFAYNSNKRGITLDINKVDGQEIFKRLVKTADIVMESFKPGYMDELGLGYNTLSQIKPDIIMTSISLFGQNGPKAHYKGSELTVWASGAYFYISGDPGRPPVWISFPQAFLHGGVEAASGTMTALWHRRMTGEGQCVDVSVQECSIAPTFNAVIMWDVNKTQLFRFSKGLWVGTKGVKQSSLYKSKDGYVFIITQGGAPPFSTSMGNLAKWIDEEGMADDWLREMDWVKGYDATTLTQDVVDRVEEAIAKFTATKTMKELYEEGGIKRHIFIAPVSRTKDIRENPQLQAQDFWRAIEHTELGDTLTYCGPFVKMSESPIKYRRRAPLIGEHNEEVYGKELGLSKEELLFLKQAKVI